MSDVIYISDVNLNGNQLKNVSFEKLDTAPEMYQGRYYYDTTKGALGYCTGDTWIYLGGSGSTHGSINSLTKEGDVFTVTYADGSSEELKLTYACAMDDELTTPVKIGGLAAGIKASELKKKTLSQIFDDILFEDIQPTVKNPSASISLISGFANNGIYEVNAPAPQSPTNFSTSFSRGDVTCPGRPKLNRAGELQSESSFIYYNGVESNTELPTVVALGQTSYQYHAAYAEGDTLYTSKGNVADIDPNPLTAGAVNSSAVTIFGTYPYFCNGKSASSSNQESDLPTEVTADTKLPLIKWTDTLIGAKFASEAKTSTRLEFYYPSAKKITKVEFMNTVSGKWEPFTTYTTASAGQKDVQGLQVDYSKLTTTGNLSGALQLRFTVTNA